MTHNKYNSSEELTRLLSQVELLGEQNKRLTFPNFEGNYGLVYNLPNVFGFSERERYLKIPVRFLYQYHEIKKIHQTNQNNMKVFNYYEKKVSQQWELIDLLIKCIEHLQQEVGDLKNN